MCFYLKFGLKMQIKNYKHKCLYFILPDIAPVRFNSEGGECWGVLEVTYDGNTYGTIDSDGWSYADTKVACKSVGCGSPLLWKTVLKDVYNLKSPIMNNVDCYGTESNLAECQRGKNVKSNSQNSVWISCSQDSGK